MNFIVQIFNIGVHKYAENVRATSKFQMSFARHTANPIPTIRRHRNHRLMKWNLRTVGMRC